MPADTRKFPPYEELSPLRKAAILLLGVDHESATIILKQLEQRAIEDVTREVASLGDVPQAIRTRVLSEFYDLALAQTWATEVALDYARKLLSASLDPKEADRIMQQISTQVRKTPFAFLQKRM